MLHTVPVGHALAVPPVGQSRWHLGLLGSSSFKARQAKAVPQSSPVGWPFALVGEQSSPSDLLPLPPQPSDSVLPLCSAVHFLSDRQPEFVNGSQGPAFPLSSVPCPESLFSLGLVLSGEALSGEALLVDASFEDGRSLTAAFAQPRSTGPTNTSQGILCRALGRRALGCSRLRDLPLSVKPFGAPGMVQLPFVGTPRYGEFG